ncbi:hypothetical protein MASSI9I_60100 [Massilia sp. 9I]|nr:hypothetical protein MASSI9I_60100 [Massilia sp. 9I]
MTGFRPPRQVQHRQRRGTGDGEDLKLSVASVGIGRIFPNICRLRFNNKNDPSGSFFVLWHAPERTDKDEHHT